MNLFGTVKGVKVTRPTINDLAKASGVSRSTINRLLSGKDNVRQPTIDRVLETAREIGFYGLGALQSRAVDQKRVYRLGFLLLQSGRAFYHSIEQSLLNANKQFPNHRVEVVVEFLDDSAPQVIAARMISLSEKVDALAVVTSQHPEVGVAIESIIESGKPVFGLLSPLATSNSQAGYIGLDNWKVGRMAAWFIENCSKRRKSDKVAVFVGNHRFRCQDLNEAGFRSFFREYSSDFTILEPQSTFESAVVSEDLTQNLLKQHPDLFAIYVAGGGISGVLAALERAEPEQRPFVVGYELMDSTRRGLMAGTMNVSIAHPIGLIADTAIETMVKAIVTEQESGSFNIRVPFDIYTRENI